MADPGHGVPVISRHAGELERAARRGDVQPALGVEHVGEREQV